MPLFPFSLPINHDILSFAIYVGSLYPGGCYCFLSADNIAQLFGIWPLSSEYLRGKITIPGIATL